MNKNEPYILVVDDEDELVSIASDYLKNLGYRVLAATNAETALSVLHANTVDLVFSDIIMPGSIDGYQLSEKIQKDYPEIKILLASGFIKEKTKTFSESNINLVALEEERLHKPYSQSELAFSIRKLLDKKMTRKR